MRVVHISPYFAPAFVYGGPPRSVLALCQGLQSAGVDVEVVTTVANGGDDLPATAAGTHHVYGGVAVHYAGRAFPSMFFNARIGDQIREALSRADLCHIHGLWNVPAWIGARTAERMKVPFFISPRGMLLPAALRQSRWKKRAAYHLLEKRHLQSALRVHATAEDEAMALRSMVDPSRIVTLSNAVDLTGASQVQPGARRLLGVSADVPLVLFLGRLHRIKRLDLLVEAFTQLQQKQPAARLVLAGPDEGGLAGLGPALAALGSSVILTGEVDDAAKWSLLSQSSVLVLCSDSENFGTAVVEALAAGCPVVATRTTPWAELAQHGCGLWVTQDVRAIAEAIGAVLADSVARSVMAAKGQAFARSRYDMCAIGTAMASLYESALSSKRQVA